MRRTGSTAVSFTVFFMSLWTMILLPKEELRFTLRLLLANLDELPRALRFLWRAEPTRLLAMGIFAVLALVCLISLLIFVRALRREKSEKQDLPEARARSEQAVGCQHGEGRERYLRQLDAHYRAGLIDRAEYKLLRERYLRMDLDEDAR